MKVKEDRELYIAGMHRVAAVAGASTQSVLMLRWQKLSFYLKTPHAACHARVTLMNAADHSRFGRRTRSPSDFTEADFIRSRN